MKTNFTSLTESLPVPTPLAKILNRSLVVVAMLFLLVKASLGQLSPGNPAKFGIDGDLKNDYRLNGSFTAAGSHDWFKMQAGTGMGVIDTTNTSAYKASLAAGNNISFSKGSSVARYSTVDNSILLDARYGRDYFGTSTGAASDLTTFAGGQKNGDNPTAWSTKPGGASVANKADIIDAYVHLRRNGTNMTSTNPSTLFATVGITTTSAIGDRFFDAEFYCSRVSYDNVTGKFSNTGSALTGGHTVWQFNLDGSVKNFGDMALTFDFTSSSVNSMYVMIWVSYTDWATLAPKNFDWTPYGYTGPWGGYGYARIQAKTGTTTVYGSMNGSQVTSTPWGTTAQTLGSASNNYYSLNYDIAQFGEAAIDLTSLGIDPALSAATNNCNPPFTRVIFKSRSSSSFTSALQDFAGPYEFLDAPVPSSSINNPAKLTCSTTSVTLSASSYAAGAYYYWTAADGSAISNSQSSSISVTKPGKYYLSSSAYYGCTETKDSVTVTQDVFQPTATAMASNILTSTATTATLLGGDTTASKYSGYQGLTWAWSGPSSYSATTQNPTTSTPGIYTLIVTEISNGCKDTAMTNVLDQSANTLASSKIAFAANKAANETVALDWTVRGESVQNFELMRSVNGSEFSVIASFAADVNSPSYQIRYDDDVKGIPAAQLLYKVKFTTATGKIQFSNIETIRLDGFAVSGLNIFPNPVVSAVKISFQTSTAGQATIQLIDATGKVAYQNVVKVNGGTNTISITDFSKMTRGYYLVRIVSGTEISNGKMIITK